MRDVSLRRPGVVDTLGARATSHVCDPGSWQRCARRHPVTRTPPYRVPFPPGVSPCGGSAVDVGHVVAHVPHDRMLSRCSEALSRLLPHKHTPREDFEDAVQDVLLWAWERRHARGACGNRWLAGTKTVGGGENRNTGAPGVKPGARFWRKRSRRTSRSAAPGERERSGRWKPSPALPIPYR